MIAKSAFRAWVVFAAVVWSAGAAAAKVGYVNLSDVLEKSPQAESASKDLEKEFRPRDEAIVHAQKRLKALEEKLNRDGAIMSESERRQLERDVHAKKREIKRDQDVFREDFNFRRNEILGQLQKQIVEVVRALAKEQAYDLILIDGVLYANDQVDLTDTVLKRLNSNTGGKS